jgi:hypothetical protein
MSGDNRNVVISCIFIGTDRGIRGNPGARGAERKCAQPHMDGVHCPITINLFYNCNGAKGDRIVSDKSPRPLEEGTPVLRSIHFSHISAVDVKIAAGFLYGLPELPLEDVDFDDISTVESARNRAVKWRTTSHVVQSWPFYSQRPKCSPYLRRIYGQEGEAFDLDESVEVKITP